ncbi:MAG: oxidoreductase [Candidatus Aenigmarchaeota archaeon]|nr:oxidoreductase [Candidatus Aenigmarchaeota archaeon]
MLFTVAEKIQETPDTVTLVFAMQKPVVYKPGQFMMASVTTGKKELLRRAYTLSSTPTRPETIAMTVKLYAQGCCSPKLGALKPGEKLEMTGPYGTFYFTETQDDVVLLAGGSGIAPMRSILLYVLDKKLPNKVTVLYSSRTTEDIIFYQELQKLAATHKQVRCFFTLTRKKPDEPWNGLTGRIDAAMVKRCVPNVLASQYFVCGPPEMVTNTIQILQEFGVDKKKIKKELW